MYWVERRPIPLTPLEIEDYRVKDSIQVVKASKSYKDSIDQINNEVTIGKILLTGYNRSYSYENYRLYFNSLINTLNYNTVEGFAPKLTVTYTRLEEEKVKYRISPEIRYGFANERAQASVNGTYFFPDKHFSRLSLGFGRNVFQFNPDNPITPYLNAYNTLFVGRNFMKIYEKSFVNASFRRELVNGLMLTTGLAYEDRNPMFNNSNYTFNITGDNPARFTPNNPDNLITGPGATATQRAFLTDLSLRIRFDQQYIDRPDGKIIFPSKYPTLYVNYRGGWPVFNTTVDFHELQLRVVDDFSFGLLGDLTWAAVGGYFLSNNSMDFNDFHHFNGNQIYLSTLSPYNFQTLDYYRYSTNQRYLELHAEHHFNEFFFNKIPGIRKLNLQTVLSTHMLTSPGVGNYMEFGVGIEHIFRFLRVDYYRGYRQGSIERAGFRVGAGF
jgi:hypothetical protein